MKRLVAIITAITLVIAGINFSPKQVDAAVLSSGGSGSWNLVWSDEFNQAAGTSVNSNYWQFDIGYGSDGWGNQERQYYTNSTDAVRVLDVDGAVDGKALAITAKRQSDGTITSGRIKTLDKQYVKYGKIEARIRTVNGMQPGVWPAFWMMGNDINSVGWPNCGEIDIMEHRNAEAQMISTLHWNPNADGSYAHVYEGSETNGQFGRFSSMDDWHTYAVEWYEDCMKFYLDGNLYETITLTDAMKEEFHKPHFILLNLAIGSTSTPFTLYTTVTDNWTESSMYVDYVRLYQGTDANFSRALTSDTSNVVTTASPTAGMTQCANNTWTAAGNVWDYNIGNSWAGASAYYTGGSQNDFSIYMSNASTANWGAMIRANQSVTAGHTYNYTINYTSTNAGSVLVKEDVSPSDEKTVDIVSGNGTISGTFTAGGSQTTAQLLMDLRGITSGTKLTITGLTLTDTTSGGTVVTTPAETTTVAPSGNTSWTTVDNSNNVYSYGNANNMSVVNVQQPPWAAGQGVFMHTSEGVSYVTINGTQVGAESVAIDGAGAVVYLSALTSSVSTVAYHRADGGIIASIDIKNANASGDEESSEEVTDAPTEAPTTTTTVAEDTNKPAAPIGLTYAGNANLPYYYAWQESADATSYNVYVNGTLVANVVGGACNIDSSYFTSAGTYTIGVTAVNASGVESDMITTTYTVESGEEAETTTVAPVITVTAPTDVEVYNFYAENAGYRVDFTEVADVASYNVYVDNSAVLTNISATETYIPASVFANYADDELHSVYLTAVDANGNESAKSEAAKLRITSLTNSNADPSDITRIYVVTNDGAKGGSTITKEDKTPASLTIISGETIINTVSDGGTIKRRGNSTSLADKPAYNISFNSKKEVIEGAAKGKKWSLLANAFDKTLMRSKLAMDFGAALGNVATPMQRYADLYIDGVYQGSYLISEPADNERSGVEMDDSDEGIDIMFEMEMERVEDGQTYYTTPLGVRMVTNEPEGLDTTTSRYTYWVNTLTAFENALTNTASDDVFNYIDMDSFVDMYIANEYFKTVDFGYSSVKYYITYDENNNPTIHAGALWDFDLSSGNSTFADIRSHEGLRGQQVNTWFRYLMQNETFKNAVIAKYTEMQPVIQNIYKANELGDSQINQLLDYMGASKDRNYASTSNGGAGWSETVVDSAENKYYPYSYGTIAPYNTYTYEQHIEFLTDWLENRNIWLCETWGVDYDYNSKEITISDDLDITGWQMTSTFDGVDGSMGIRTVYQIEDTVDGQETTEVGLVYGLIYGDNPITADDVVYGSDNAFVASYAGTNNGISEEILGDSETATYYVRTMSCGLADGSDNITAAGYTAEYYVRAYAKLADGSIVYSNAYTYTIFDVADVLYQNNLVNTKSTYDYLYTKILSYVDSTYKEGDFDWSNTIVK